jgi:YgiT-type zinc finger domain-containing protein
MTAPTEERAETCPECQVGSLHPRNVPYYAHLDGMLITVPDFPAWVCDVCHHCEYDTAALDDLRAILGPNASLPEESSRQRRMPTGDSPSWPIELNPRGHA